MSIYLSQQDPRWSNKQIGKSYLTIGRAGCAITSLCIALGKFGILMLPSTMASHEEWFTSQGLIVWKSVEVGLKKLYPHKNFSITRYYGRNDQAIQQNLKPGSAVLLQVSGGSHWVCAERKHWFRNDYTVADSWGGVARSAVGDYKDITGYTILKVT